MSRISKLPLWATVLIVGVGAAFSMAFVHAVHSGVSPAVAARTYVFWALVCAPVAYLAELLGRSALEYRLVRVVVDRVVVTFTDR